MMLFVTIAGPLSWTAAPAYPPAPGFRMSHEKRIVLLRIVATFLMKLPPLV